MFRYFISKKKIPLEITSLKDISMRCTIDERVQSVSQRVRERLTYRVATHLKALNHAVEYKEGQGK